MKNKHQAASYQQQPPIEGDIVIVDEVVSDLKARKQFGVDKYGTPLMSNNGRNALLDAYQEALDLCCYLKQALIEHSYKKVSRYGCHIEYENKKVKESNKMIFKSCVIEYGKPEDCDFCVANGFSEKEECVYWKVVEDYNYFEG